MFINFMLPYRVISFIMASSHIYVTVFLFLFLLIHHCLFWCTLTLASICHFTCPKKLVSLQVSLVASLLHTFPHPLHVHAALRSSPSYHDSLSTFLTSTHLHKFKDTSIVLLIRHNIKPTPINFV